MKINQSFKRNRMRKKKLLPFVVCSLLILTITACNRQEKKVNETAVIESDKIQKVEVVHPKQRSFIAEISITGTAKPNQITTVYAMESGMLSEIHKDIGDEVSKGEIIAVLENPELIQQKMKWKAEFQAKKKNYERLHGVYKKTPALTNKQMVEDAEADYLSAKANLDAINNRISFLSIKAPFSGIITKRCVDVGAMIQNGLQEDNPQSVFEIQEVDPIRLTIPVPESDAVGIQEGMEAEITFPELSGEIRVAKVSRTSKALDPGSKTMQVEIDLENPDAELISGMYAKVLLQINSRDNILSLPIISKTSHKNEDHVLVVENGIVKRLAVKIGLSDRNFFEVLNPEITSETKVIVQGKGLVNLGQKVDPILKKLEN